MKMKRTLILTFTLLAAGTDPSYAANRLWQNPVNGPFDGTGHQWNFVPGSSDIARFANYADGSDFEVSLTQNVTTESLRTEGAGPFTARLNLNGFTYTTTNAENDLNAIARTSSSVNHLVIKGGGTFEAIRFSIANGVSSHGTLTVEGGSRLLTSGEMRIGNVSTGVLQVTSGALYEGSGSNYFSYNANVASQLLVSGNGSRWSATGESFFGRGADSSTTVSVVGGGVLESTATGTNAAMNLAVGTGSTVNVTVSGEDSIFRTAGRINLGGSRTAAGGSATLTVTDQGLVRSGLFTLYSGGTLTVNQGRLEANAMGEAERLVDGTINLTLGASSAPAAIAIRDDLLLGSGTLNLTLADDAEYEVNDIIRLIDYRGTQSGSFSNYTEGQQFSLGGHHFQFSYQMPGDTGHFVGLTVIPEPGSTALVASGLLFAAGARQYKIRRKE